MLSLQQPRHIPTLPIATQTRCPRYVRSSLNFRHDVEAVSNDAMGQKWTSAALQFVLVV